MTSSDKMKECKSLNKCSVTTCNLQVQGNLQICNTAVDCDGNSLVQLTPSSEGMYLGFFRTSINNQPFRVSPQWLGRNFIHPNLDLILTFPIDRTNANMTYYTSDQQICSLKLEVQASNTWTASETFDLEVGAGLYPTGTPVVTSIVPIGTLAPTEITVVRDITLTFPTPLAPGTPFTFYYRFVNPIPAPPTQIDVYVSMRVTAITC